MLDIHADCTQCVHAANSICTICYLKNVLLLCSGNCFQVNRAVRTDHTQKQWVDLGFLCEACITRPETCGPEGAAVGFWLKLIDCPNRCGIISSFQKTTGFVFRCSSENIMLVLNVGKGSTPHFYFYLKKYYSSLLLLIEVWQQRQESGKTTPHHSLIAN